MEILELSKVTLSLGYLGLRKINETEQGHLAIRFALSFVLSEKRLDWFFDHLKSTEDLLGEQLKEVGIFVMEGSL